jgi:hypothetical protein
MVSHGIPALVRPQLKAEVQNVDTLNRKLSALEELLSQSQAEAR